MRRRSSFSAVLFYQSCMGFSSGLGSYCHGSWALSQDHEHPLPFTLTTVAGSTGPPPLIFFLKMCEAISNGVGPTCCHGE